MGGRDRGMGWAEGGMLDGWEGVRTRRMGGRRGKTRGGYRGIGLALL
jgi:hypothetical protein